MRDDIRELKRFRQPITSRQTDRSFVFAKMFFTFVIGLFAGFWAFALFIYPNY